jgi:hypothetical protein
VRNRKRKRERKESKERREIVQEIHEYMERKHVRVFTTKKGQRENNIDRKNEKHV